MSGFFRRRLQLQLLLILLAAVSVAALSVLLIWDSIQNAEKAVLADMGRQLNAAPSQNWGNNIPTGSLRIQPGPPFLLRPKMFLCVPFHKRSYVRIPAWRADTTSVRNFWAIPSQHTTILPPRQTYLRQSGRQSRESQQTGQDRIVSPSSFFVAVMNWFSFKRLPCRSETQLCGRWSAVLGDQQVKAEER